MAGNLLPNPGEDIDMDLEPTTVQSMTEKEIESHYEKMESRRELVFEMLIQGATKSHMARELSVNRKTIDSDVAYWEKKMGQYVAGLKTSEDRVAIELGGTIKKLDWIVQNAIMEYSASKVAVSKNRFLNTALKAVAVRNSVLTTTGFLPKAGVEISVKASGPTGFGAIFGSTSPFASVDNPVSQRKVMELAARGINMKAARAAEEVIEVEAAPKPDEDAA